jgi:hypothetical protein
MAGTFPVVDLTAAAATEPLSPIPEELRCQYSSKRCENQRTHKKSGGLHKFCAIHREKANRNQMRLDHRRRVMKQQQKELQRQQQIQAQQQQQQMQMQRPHSLSAASMAAGQNFHYSRRMQRSPVGYKPASPPNMTISMSMPMHSSYQAMEVQAPQMLQQQEQQQPNLPLFNKDDLEILEALLFSSDEEQADASPIVHCSAPQIFRSPSFVNV